MHHFAVQPLDRLGNPVHDRHPPSSPEEVELPNAPSSV
jgi:hypothetical protein